MRAPKRYECTNCGFVGNKFREVEFPLMSFAVCFKCRGRLIEREEWLEWLHAERTKLYGIREVESK